MTTFPDRVQVAEAFELALDVPSRPRTMNVAFLLDDKAAFDQVQQWLSLKEGRRLTQWETITRILAFALDHPELDAVGLRASRLSRAATWRRGGRQTRPSPSRAP